MFQQNSTLWIQRVCWKLFEDETVTSNMNSRPKYIDTVCKPLFDPSVIIRSELNYLSLMSVCKWPWLLIIYDESFWTQLGLLTALLTLFWVDAEESWVKFVEVVDFSGTPGDGWICMTEACRLIINHVNFVVKFMRKIVHVVCIRKSSGDTRQNDFILWVHKSCSQFFARFR